MKAHRIPSALLLAALLVPTLAGAQRRGHAFGVVSDPDGEPITGVQVEVIDIERGDRPVADDETDEKGKYSVVVLDATRSYLFRLSKDGYQSVEGEIKLPTGGNEEYDWTLTPIPTQPQSTPEGEAGAQAPPVPAEGEIQVSAEAEVPYNEGVQAIQAGDKTTAKLKFEEALAIDPNIGPAWMALAAFSLEAGDFASAAEQADKALAIDPTDTRALQVKYQAHTALGQEDEAAQARAALAELAPEETAEALMQEGVDAFNGGDMDTAIAALEQVVIADPDLYKAHYMLGMAYANKQDNASAVEHLKAFLEVAPADDSDVPVAREMLAYVEGQS